MTNHEYDFKGNLLSSSRQLAPNYSTFTDWLESEPETDHFTHSTTYDALNRPTNLTTPDNSQIRPTYNEAGLLERLEAVIPGLGETTFLENIDYDAKGQRRLIEYGNRVKTRYTYDPHTFRLTHLLTTRGRAFPEDCPPPPPPPNEWPGCGLQNLRYTYDPTGNITHIRDDAQQTIFFHSRRVEPSNDYRYDAIYRLIEATGREHIGQLSRPWTSWNDAGRVGLEHPHNGLAMRPYTEEYEYDEVGNFESISHYAEQGEWVRTYTYEETSLIEPNRRSNRLSRTTVDGETQSYTYDRHGNMTSMPHLNTMVWDFHDQLQQVDLLGGGTEYYVYDASGERVRKVTERQNGTRHKERIYLGGYEVFREYNGNGFNVIHERETLHIMYERQRIALVETRTHGVDGSPGQLVRYQLGNHLGSACLELDSEAQVISYEEYYPYGSSSYQAVRGDVEVNSKRYRYTGMERDEETGFSYHGARYYAPWLGRWSSPDPAGLIDGQNLYRYVLNSPVSAKDVTGLGGDGNEESWSEWIKRIFQGPLSSDVARINQQRVDRAERLRERAHSPDATFFDFWLSSSEDLQLMRRGTAPNSLVEFGYTFSQGATLGRRSPVPGRPITGPLTQRAQLGAYHTAATTRGTTIAQQLAQARGREVVGRGCAGCVSGAPSLSTLTPSHRPLPETDIAVPIAPPATDLIERTPGQIESLERAARHMHSVYEDLPEEDVVAQMESPTTDLEEQSAAPNVIHLPGRRHRRSN